MGKAMISTLIIVALGATACSEHEPNVSPPVTREMPKADTQAEQQFASEAQAARAQHYWLEYKRQYTIPSKQKTNGPVQPAAL